MSALGGVINSVIDAATGKTSGTTLDSFLSKFGSSAGKHVDTINPLATFEVSFAFEPTSGSKSTFGVLDALGTAGTSMITNALNNVSGGLLGGLLSGSEGVMQEHNSFSKVGQHTFMEYLAKANLLVGGENWFNPEQGLSPLELQLGFYVQSITVPQVKLIDDQRTNTLLGDFPVNGVFIQPDVNTVQFDIINTKLPIIERLFYPWMKEVTLPFWSYESQPYTTATITIDFSKHTDIQYVFTGCRPCNLQMIQPQQEPTAPLTRQATIMFDFMFITSKSLPVMTSAIDKLLGAGKTLFNGAANMMNL